jgi:hypothetical protein
MTTLREMARRVIDDNRPGGWLSIRPGRSPSPLPARTRRPTVGDMRKPNRNVVLTVVAVEAAAAALAYRDLARRADDEVRGRKLLWRIFIGLNPGNSLVYWLFGRRRVGPSTP